MKVLMLGRTDLLTEGGGDKIQVQNTADELRKLGVEVDIENRFDVDMSSYDIIHIFQLDWGYESYFHTQRAKKYNKPIVFSPIHHLMHEVKKHDDEYVFDYRRLTKYMFKDQFHRDTYKMVYRCFFNPKKIKPTLITIVKGLKNMHIEALKLSDIVLVQTVLEAQDLKKVYGVDITWEKAPNGVGNQFINQRNTYENKLGIENYFISVGRLEPRKNHLTLIQALKQLRQETDLDLQLLLIGKKALRNHVEYTLRMNKELENNKWLHHVDHVPYAEIAAYYHFAKVGVSLSWFETTGLTMLEALFCGCNIVASSEPTKEYLGNYAEYCSPNDITQIKQALLKAYKSPRPVVDDSLKHEYTWKRAAEKTLEVYNKLLELKP